jgi:hypothetical protein
VEPIKVMRSGSNAVDMHIAYYVGRLVEKEPAAEIHIISGDTDFDPLVEYLKSKGVKCKRAKSIAEIAKQAQVKPQLPAASRHTRSVTSVARKPHRGHGRLKGGWRTLPPRDPQKLAQTIANYFRHHGGQLADDAVELIIDDLIRLKYVSRSARR